MKRIGLVVAVCVLSSGCRAPMPNWNSFGPYGNTRVPPPATGGYGTPQPYYAPAPGSTIPPTSPTSAPVGTGFRDSTLNQYSSLNRWSNIEDPAVGPITQLNTWAPTRPTATNAKVVDLSNVDVALASHEAALPIVGSAAIVQQNTPIRIVQPSSVTPTSTLPRLRGMVVNDATRSSEPRQFVPSGRVIQMSELPDAPIARASTVPRPVRSASSETSVSSGGWKSRTTTLKVVGS